MTVEQPASDPSIACTTPCTIGRPAEILLVEDNPADAELAMIGLRGDAGINNIHVARDGEEAWEFLTQVGDHAGAPRPDIVLLDLNLPGLSGGELLRNIKTDEDLRSIPVIVLTTSDADQDVRSAYCAHANAYMVKPVDFQQFHHLLQGFKKYWLSMVCLPKA